MFDAVLFDLDGTLVETAPEIADAVNATLAARGMPAVDEALVRIWIGNGTRALMLAACAHAMARDRQALEASAEFAETMRVFDGHYAARCGTRSHLFPAVRETLERLRGMRVPLAVVTNKEARYTRQVLLAHGLEAAFDLLVCGDTLARKKPDALPVIHCLRHFAVTAQRTVLVGDSAVDIAAARAAGIRVWAVPYGYNAGVPIAESGPDRVIQTIAEILPVLR
jgi:phosphoglycolate phosphatase